MTPGRLIRVILGPSTFRIVGRAYRAIFVDLKKVAMCSSGYFPRGAHILDIGGGDGEPLNHLLKLRGDITVTMIDVAESVGGAVDDNHRPRVSMLPNTSVKEYFERKHPPVDGVIISDVLHHIGRESRSAFFSEVHKGLSSAPLVPIVIKDIEPGSFIAWLARVTDRYITGDKSVCQMSRAELISLLKPIFPNAVITETELYLMDRPNYSIVVSH